MKKLVGFVFLLISLTGWAQVDTSYVYNTTTPYGTLDIRIAKSSSRYYYLQENITSSFRESSPGVKTNTFKDMTSWDSSPYSQGNLREKSGSSDYFTMNYRLLFPQSYNSSYSEGYPLIVMVHGYGEVGNCFDVSCYWATRDWRPTTNTPAAPTTSTHSLLNNDHNLLHGGLPHLTARNLAGSTLPNDPALNSRAFPGFVLFPQNLNGWDATAVQDMIRLIRLTVKKYNIDPDRVYIHGLSNGGAGVYEAIKRAPWLFAAALPMSAVNDASIHSKFLAPTVATIPLWTFQGGQDIEPTPAKTEGYVKKFREAGMDVRYTLYKNLGHGTWNDAYSEPDFFSWILNKNKSKVHVFYNNPVICSTNLQGAKLGYAAGFRAYQWEKDGEIVEGATTHELIAAEPGTYRARFSRKANPSESDWNNWSQPVVVTTVQPSKPSVTVVGTRLMRGPDNDVAYNTVVLKSNQVNDKYFWYRNGILVNIPNTSLDDTTRTFTLYSTSSSANGKYTLQTQGFDNCPSPASDTIRLYFNNSATTISSSNQPSNFTGSALSNKSTQLSWTDRSTIEAGYEIWRRKPGSFFRLAGVTPPNATSFIDDNLEPSVSYDYKIRTITETGKSNYIPSNTLTTNLVITTLEDTEAPTAPTDLVVTRNTHNSITLSWTGSSDDTGIRRYVLNYGSNSVATPTNATTYTIENLPMNVAYSITVRAEDLGGNESELSNSVVGSTYVTGLNYGYSTGAWTDLDLITNWENPEYRGKVNTITLAPRTQEDYFRFEFTGFVYINNGGNYQFRTTSDDGSRLALNDVVIVNNDGIHGDTRVTSATQALASGPHALNVRYFEYSGGQSLSVQYRGPDTFNFWASIPASALKSGSTPPVVATSIESPVVMSETRLSEDFVVNVYPNPSAADNIQVRVSTKTDAPVDVKMVDMMGRPYYNNTFSAAQAQLGAKITPTNLVLNGMYVIVVKQGASTVKQKIIIKN